jgi:hypothetical protein
VRPVRSGADGQPPRQRTRRPARGRARLHTVPPGSPRRRRRPGPAPARRDRPVPAGRRHRRCHRRCARRCLRLGRAPDDDRGPPSGRTRRGAGAVDVLFRDGAQLGRTTNVDQRRPGSGDRGGQPLDPCRPDIGRPTGLGDDFTSAYGEAARGRRVSSRLQLPVPPPDAEARPWAIRRVDIDPLGHVNNAAQWAIVEETLPAEGSRRGLAEVEHVAAVDADGGSTS